MPKTITADQRLQLIGLLALAREHNKMLKDIERAAYSITDERDREGRPETCGHTSDAIFCDYAVDDLLSRLEIAVEPSQAVDAVDPVAPDSTA
jgi:hypothetical protein